MKVLVVDEMHESLGSLLNEIGLEMVYQPKYTREDIMLHIGDYEGLIIRSKTQIDREIIDRASKLRFIGRAGSGVDNLDVDALKERNIHVVNAPEGNRDALGEHSIGMILSILHRLRKSDWEVRKNVWDREGNRGYELKGRTVGIFGFGFMGSAFAEKLSGFGCEVIAYDKFKSGFGTKYVKEVNLSEFKKKTEILSINTPLTNETRFLFDYNYLRDFEKLFIVLNTARGEILVLKDLLKLIKEGRVMGAALDVLENEKFAQLTDAQKEVLRELQETPFVHFSPHIAGWTHESYHRINRVLVEKISKLAL